MESKVNPILKLTKGGRTVEGNGPIVKWKKVELSAMVTFVIVQPSRPANRRRHSPFSSS